MTPILVLVLIVLVVERTADNFGHCFNDGINSDIPCYCPKIGSVRLWDFGRCIRHNYKKCQKYINEMVK